MKPNYLRNKDLNQLPQTLNHFESDARSAVNGLRSALADLMAEVRGDPAQPQEIARRFGLDKTLTWKIARVICDDDSLAAAVHVPGRASVRALVEAMSKDGAPEDRTQPVIAAMDRFEQFITTHCGDRTTFEVMLAGASGGMNRKRAEVSRKSFYQGASAIWGVQARVHVSLHFVAPNAREADRLDLAVVAGFLGFRRLRPEVSWTVAAMATHADEGVPVAHRDIRPMDPALKPGDTPLLKQFCSSPLPELRKNTRRSNVTRYELAEGPIGITAAADCITGWVAKGEVNRFRAPDDHLGEHIVRLSTPVEVLYHDFYVHRELTFAMKPTIHLYSDLPGGPVFPLDGLDRGRLPIAEEIIDLGEGPPSTSAADIPNYRAMVETAAKSLDHTLKDFHAFRFRMKYPPIPAQALFRYELPERA